ncbi:DUF2076 domain-containing protein [Pseudomonas stutzeri]|nr:DUF2076 domain-containing protein [Stutzerimonas stutzeri]
MHAEEKNLIDGLFTRLRDVEGQAAPREAQAEALINEHIARQPAAPYYMAQAIIVQENAIQQLDARIKELEAQIESLQRVQSQPQQSSGGFLAGLFGGRSQPQPQAQVQPQPGAQSGRSGWQEPAGASRFGQQPGFAQQSAFGQRGAPAQGGGFLSGALQTAAGVAGGMMLGNLLMDMFKGDEAQQVAEAAPAEEAQLAQEAPAAEEHYADSGFFGGDEGGFFDGGDDEDFV